MTQSEKKRSFSLLEILICLAIITLIASYVGVRVVDLLSSHRATSSCQSLTDRIKELQVLALSHGMDCQIRIDLREKDPFFQCFNDADLSRGPLFSKHPLRGVTALYIDGKKETFAEIAICSDGRVLPAKVLAFSFSKKGQAPSLWIDLRRSLYLCLSTDKPRELPPFVIPEFSNEINPLVDK